MQAQIKQIIIFVVLIIAVGALGFRAYKQYRKYNPVVTPEMMEEAMMYEREMLGQGEPGQESVTAPDPAVNEPPEEDKSNAAKAFGG